MKARPCQAHPPAPCLSDCRASRGEACKRERDARIAAQTAAEPPWNGYPPAPEVRRHGMHEIELRQADHRARAAWDPRQKCWHVAGAPQSPQVLVRAGWRYVRLLEDEDD